MTNEQRIEKLKEILKYQIAWYESHKDDPERVYDDLVEEFSELNRGDFVAIIETLVEE